MRHLILIAFTLSGGVLASCATSIPFDRPPEKFPSAAELSKREAVSQLTCIKDPAKPVARSPGLYPFSDGIRTGRVEFIFDLDEAGKTKNIRIRSASEEVFVPHAFKTVETWQYEARQLGEPANKRENLCSSLTFMLQDERGRAIPTWTDIEEQTKAYQRYKRYLENQKK